MAARIVELHLPIDGDDDLRALRGALLRARATELAELRRQGSRLSNGYGSDSARDTMTSTADAVRLRWLLLGHLIDELDRALDAPAGARDGPATREA